MSYKLGQLIIRRRLGDGPTLREAKRKMVLIALADVANDDGSSVFPSIATIVARAACSRRTVDRAFAEFETEGILKRVRKNQNGVTVWRINADLLTKLPTATPTAQDGASPTHWEDGETLTEWVSKRDAAQP